MIDSLTLFYQVMFVVLMIVMSTFITYLDYLVIVENEEKSLVVIIYHILVIIGSWFITSCLINFLY